MDFLDWSVFVIVFWSVYLFFGVDERVHFDTYSVSVEIDDVEDM